MILFTLSSHVSSYLYIFIFQNFIPSYPPFFYILMSLYFHIFISLYIFVFSLISSYFNILHPYVLTCWHSRVHFFIQLILVIQREKPIDFNNLLKWWNLVDFPFHNCEINANYSATYPAIYSHLSKYIEYGGGSRKGGRGGREIRARNFRHNLWRVNIRPAYRTFRDSMRIHREWADEELCGLHFMSRAWIDRGNFVGLIWRAPVTSAFASLRLFFIYK